MINKGNDTAELFKKNINQTNETEGPTTTRLRWFGHARTEEGQ